MSYFLTENYLIIFFNLYPSQSCMKLMSLRVDFGVWGNFQKSLLSVRFIQSHYIEVAQGGVSSRAIQNWLWIFSIFFSKKYYVTFQCDRYNIFRKRGYQIGNTKIDKKGDSPFFWFFPLVPLVKWRKEKLFRWAKILWGFRKSQIKHLLKISPVISKTGESPLLSIFVFPIWYPFQKVKVRSWIRSSIPEVVAFWRKIK